ncbi:unnamed protein product [Adineta steineri]|uniref:RING-type domain-containing protein n=1 Tax=Adineta steineri TaxID=433720 RepID=A0A814LE80_9BILA|nr:unnamed protein product [Adineta steineri]CAF3782507.1 unnamed protein product [Adineta steineri]
MSTQQTKSLRGLQVGNTNDIDTTLFCAICNLLLHKPIQLLCCGTRLCRWCSKKNLSDSESFVCPFCQTKLPQKQEHADRGAERELNRVITVCYSCSWTGSYKDYLDHLQEYHADIECGNCHERFFSLNSMEEHEEEICEYRCVQSEFSLSIEESNTAGSCESKTVSNTSTQLTSKYNQLKTNNEFNLCRSKASKVLNIDSSINFPFHLNQTDMNLSVSMYSSLFKTTQVGYSFILRVCSTTDSTDQNQQYLSVFISLVRGEFDQLLVFPFPYTIFLYLCDQSGQGKHIISAIKPDSNESALSRPLSEKNDEIGVLNFRALNCINEAGSIYLKDNVFLIRVFIDFLNTGPTPFQFETVT